MIKLLFLLLAIPFLFACGSAPKHSGPLLDVMDVSLVPTSAPLLLKNSLYREILREAHSNRGFKVARHYSRRSNLSKWYRGGLAFVHGTNLDYHYVYKIDSNNQLVRRTLNEPWHGDRGDVIRDCMLCSDKGFTEYADRLAVESVEDYNKYINELYLYRTQNDDKNLQLQDQIKKVEVTATSPFSINQNDMQGIANKVRTHLSAGSVSYTGGRVKVVEPQINIYWSNPVSFNRLRDVRVELSATSLKAGDVPIVNVSINSGFFDLLPEVFNADNSDIVVVLDQGTLKVTNNTNNFIDIESFTIYFGDKADTLPDLGLSIPPQATSEKTFSQSFEVFNAPPSAQNPRYIELGNPQGTFHFGVALSYFNVDTNVRNTLLKRKVYSRTDF